MILIGGWKILTNKKMVEKAIMESKTEATMWKRKAGSETGDPIPNSDQMEKSKTFDFLGDVM